MEEKIEPSGLVETDIQEIENEGRKPVAKRWIILAVLGILVLAGAAFVGARLLNDGTGGAAAAEMSPFGKGAVMSSKGGGVQKSVKLNMKNAEEIPQRAPDVGGVIKTVKDSSVLVGTNARVMTTVEKNSDPEVNIESDGPETEVVITRETQIYRDTTFEELTMDGPPDENVEIQQIVEPVEFKELEKDSMVSVWGYRRGDRVIAEVMLYSKPVMFKRGK